MGSQRVRHNWVTELNWTSNGRKGRGTKEFLDKGEGREWISWLKTQHLENEDHGIQSHHFMEIGGGTMETVTDFIFGGSKITADRDCSHEIKRHLLLGRKAMTNPWQHFKKQRHHFAKKGPYSQSYSFSSSHVWMWELNHKECWAPKKWYFLTLVLEKTLENPLGFRETNSVNPKGNQPWIFIGRTDAEAEAPILWPPGAKSWLIRKDLDAGKDWRQEENGVTKDEMVI